jgi:hypothetical protein
MPMCQFLITAALVSGCGSGVYPVEGKLVWQDGAPVTELTRSIVTFESEQTSAQGTIQADGSFRLTTNTPDDGAPAGEYKVLIMEVGRKTLPGSNGTLLAPSIMDPRYSDVSTTDLSAKVTPGTNEVTLTIERNPQR